MTVIKGEPVSDNPCELESYLELPRAHSSASGLVFTTRNGMGAAFNIGAFLLEIPTGLGLGPGLKICQNFYRPRVDSADLYRGHTGEGHPLSQLGYEDRPNQVEQFQLESRFWEECFPREVTALLMVMRGLTRSVLHCLLQASGARSEDWAITTGGTSQETSLCYTTLNHYRSSVCDALGIVPHTDSGFITVISADRDGFEVFLNGVWRPIRNEPGYFVVNLGDAFEILTAGLPCPGKAVLHRVLPSYPEPGNPDRSSFTLYMGVAFNRDLYTYASPQDLRVYQSFREFSQRKAQKMNYAFHARA